MNTRKFLTVTFILTISLTACGQTKNKSLNEKKNIDNQRIDRIEISKRASPSDTTMFPLKVLTIEQVTTFADKWNKGTYSELRKYLPSFTLTVYLKSGALRHFRVGGKFIKENNDFCFDFGNENYFSDLYSNANITSNISYSTLKTGWYYIADTDNGFKRQLDQTTEYYFIDPSVIVPLEQFEKLELTDNKDNFPMLIIRFDKNGTNSWSIATEKAIDKNLALIINDKLVATPKVNSQITAGVSALSRTGYDKQDLDEILKTIEAELQSK